ncbi:MAG TPA: DUF930 domain-containing protein [Rhizobiaceae bacterium]|nr:DUF930 domain-containing protein [Rhizobiaceae bacterium]
MEAGWGFGASLAFHALLFIAILLSPVGPDFSPPEVTVPIELVPVAPEVPEMAPQAPEPVLSAPRETPAVPTIDPAPAVTAGYVRATTLMSAAALADPRSARARREMRTLAERERIVQLCNIEAMQQIGSWDKKLDPDFVIAYARSSEQLTGNVIAANGAVVHSGDDWYDLRFNCELAPAHDSVAAFEFRLGKPVPLAEQEELSLPTEIDDGDDD